MKKAIVMFLAGVILITFAACHDFSRPAAADPTVFKASEIYDAHGFGTVTVAQSGTYSFKAADSEGVEWTVYVLDEEFEDGLRYISHAYEAALVGDGELELTEGQWVYVQCSANDLTGTEVPEGASLSFTLVK